MKIRKLVIGGTLLVFAFTGGALQARTPGQNQDNHGQDQRDRDHGNQNNHGQNHDRFDDHDRQVSRDWYNQHHDNRPRGLRDRDRLFGSLRIDREGYVLDPYMRMVVYGILADYYCKLALRHLGDTSSLLLAARRFD